MYIRISQKTEMTMSANMVQPLDATWDVWGDMNKALTVRTVTHLISLSLLWDKNDETNHKCATRTTLYLQIKTQTEHTQAPVTGENLTDVCGWTVTLSAGLCVFI